MTTSNDKIGSPILNMARPTSFWRQRIVTVFSEIVVGRLKLYEKNELLLDVGSAPEEQAVRVYIQSVDAYRSMALGGSLGAAEAYMDGDWVCSDLLSVLVLILKNRQVMGDLDGGWSLLRNPMLRIQHWLNRDTPAQSKRNIAAHYDLGNAFFEQFLDDTMMYSSG
ncbi:MAG: class I SAM-dependent methyltransferase, partial [Pseudomonadales bacterium]